LFFTAHIERPLFHRGGSASKKNGLPTPSPHSEAARCASTEDHQAPSPLLFREQEDNQATLLSAYDRYHQSPIKARSYHLQEGSPNRSSTARTISPAKANGC